MSAPMAIRALVDQARFYRHPDIRAPSSLASNQDLLIEAKAKSDAEPDRRPSCQERDGGRFLISYDEDECSRAARLDRKHHQADHHILVSRHINERPLCSPPRPK